MKRVLVSIVALCALAASAWLITAQQVTTAGPQISNPASSSVFFKQTTTVDVAGAYAADDLWCNEITLTNAFVSTMNQNETVTSKRTGKLQSLAIMLTEDKSAPAVQVLVFSRPCAYTNAANSAWAVPASSMQYLLGTISIASGDWQVTSGNTNAFVAKYALNLPVCNTYTNQNLYLSILAQDTTQLTNAAPTIIANVVSD